MRFSDRMDNMSAIGRDFPKIRGNVKFTLKNVHNGKTEVYEHHNDATNALKDIFAGNYGGLVNYNNFASLYSTWLGGVLVFANPLDVVSTGWADDYGIPSRTSNAIIAHAGQTTLSDQADDLTRGNPDNSGIVTQAGSTKLVWEWGTSAGNGTISSLGLTHSDTGSYFTGAQSEAMKSFNPFADVACLSRSYEYGDSASFVMGINDNYAYNIYLVDSTHIKIYKTPINNTKYKLQGDSLIPIKDKANAYSYTTTITATLPTAYAYYDHGSCYFYFDFDNGNLLLFGTDSSDATKLYKDVISLSDGTVTHSVITVTGAILWDFRFYNGRWFAIDMPLKAMIDGNYLYVYGKTNDNSYPTKMFKINLSNTADIAEVDCTNYSKFHEASTGRTLEKWSVLGGLIVHDSFIINGDKTFQVEEKNIRANYYAFQNAISSPCFRAESTANMIAVNKLYLATKWNLPSTVTKTSAQSMTVEYTLTET